MRSLTEVSMPATLYWEDLLVGSRFQTSGRTITESDVVSFACLTADFNPVHVDAQFASSSAFGQRIAHGLLVASISVGLVTRTPQNAMMEKSLIGLLENRLTFPNPTFFGDTVHVVVDVVEARETKKPERGLVVFNRRTINQREEVVIESTVTMLIQRRSTALER